MPFWLAIVGAILVLALLIFVHELGHFLAARRNGVQVDAFAIGFGPALWSKKKGDTTYALRLFPLGGYVKLYGEDATDPTFLKSKKSFVAKSPWQRFQILFAGVFVNFVVAFLLFLLAFWFKVPPLLTSQEQIQDYLVAGKAEHFPALVVDKGTDLIDSGSILTSVNGALVTVDLVTSGILSDTVADTTMFTFTTAAGVEANLVLEAGESLQDEGVLFTSAIIVPRVQITDSTLSFLPKGTTVVTIDGQAVLQAADLDVLYDGAPHTLQLWDGQTTQNITGVFADLFTDPDVIQPTTPAVYIPYVSTNSLAEKAGIVAPGYLDSVNDEFITSAAQAQKLLAEAGSDVVLNYMMATGQNELQDYLITREPGELLGLYLADALPTQQYGFNAAVVPMIGSLSFTELAFPSFVTAPLAAVSYLGKVSWLTISGFSQMIVGMVTSFAVPDEVGGPVAVAQITTHFLQTDVPGLLWLVGIISASLAVMNLLPIPALDGGRILFVLIEVLRGGKRVSQKFEMYVHMFGFIFLLSLIVLVSFKDIARLFAG